MDRCILQSTALVGNSIMQLKQNSGFVKEANTKLDHLHSSPYELLCPEFPATDLPPTV